MTRKKQHKVAPNKATQKIEVLCAFPCHNVWLFTGVLGLSFLVNFVLYLVTLAPTVTFEDSGELISAAYNLGVPHQPGYPLFTLLARVFTFLPFGTIAYRVNLMSAFFTAAAGVCVCWATILLIENTFMRSKFFKMAPARSMQILTFSLGLCSAILFGTALTTWEQAIITEVYGLNSFLVALFIFLALWLGRLSNFLDKKRVLFLLSYICGLALANHTTSLMLIPLLGVYLWIFEKKLLVDLSLLLKSFLFFILGLTPYVYLPIASARNPVIDWGNPENLTNFIRVITRNQYDDGTKQTIEGFLSQFSFFCSDLLMYQWMPLVLLFAVAGMIYLFQKNRSAFYFVLAGLFFTMPVTSWMTNFDVTNTVAAVENKPLVSVFYIPAYLIISMVIGIGLFRLSVFLSIKKYMAAIIGICLPLAVAVSAIIRTMPEVSMHNYPFAQDYSDNVFNTMKKNSLYFVNWDPYYFPTMYYQFVEKKRPDLLVLDQQLLRRSWYINWLQNYYPEFIRQSEREVNVFLQAIKPFENGERYDGDYVENCYFRMINAFIDSKLGAHKNVYFAYTPDPAIMRSGYLESQFFAYNYTQQRLDTTITDTGLKLLCFTDNNIHRDRMADRIRNYYGNMYALRGLQLQKIAGDSVKAFECYKKAQPFFDRNTNEALFIEQKLSRGSLN